MYTLIIYSRSIQIISVLSIPTRSTFVRSTIILLERQDNYINVTREKSAMVMFNRENSSLDVTITALASLGEAHINDNHSRKRKRKLEPLNRSSISTSHLNTIDKWDLRAHLSLWLFNIKGIH